MNAGQPPRSPARPHGSPAREPRGLLPPWPAVLAVVAHPDDESFGLGAIIDKMAGGEWPARSASGLGGSAIF